MLSIQLDKLFVNSNFLFLDGGVGGWGGCLGVLHCKKGKKNRYLTQYFPKAGKEGGRIVQQFAVKKNK